MSTKHHLTVYDRLRPHLVADDLLARLGVDVARRIGSELYCRPLCHESTSGESLQVNAHTGRWNCKACQQSGYHGDLIQLVEYVRTNGRAPTHSTDQGNSPTHRDAVRWLCQQYGIPYEEHGRAGGYADPALDVVHLFSMEAHRYLLGQEDVLGWIRDQWGFDRSTVEAYGIGFMPDPILPRLAAEAERPESRGAFRASGVGFFTDGHFVTRFAGRVIFPYLENGRAVYLIGRATPWTRKPDGHRRVSKYHKLTVHSETRPHISQRITNDHLYLEPVLREVDRVVVTEGVADAVALSSIGVPVVSPVTISFNEVDLERFVARCHENDIRLVEILFDNELSGSGNYGAVRVGRKLVERGIRTKILSLPLGPEQEAARKEVLEAIGADAFAELEQSDPKRRKEILSERLPEESRREWVARQVEASKIDAAEWVAQAGAGAVDDFEKVRAVGVDVVRMICDEVAHQVDQSREPQERLAMFAEVVQLAAGVDDRMTRNDYAGMISDAAGRGVTKIDVGQAIAAARREVKRQRKEDESSRERRERESTQVELVVLPPASRTDPRRPEMPPKPGESPPAVVDDAKLEHEMLAVARANVARSVEQKVSEEIVGRYVADTIVVTMLYTVFRTPEELVLVRGNERVDVGITRPTPAFRRLLYLAAGLTPSKALHRSYIDSAIYFLERGSSRANDVSWSHYDRDDGSIYFPTADEAGTIFRITAGDVFLTYMREARVPAVAGKTFLPFKYAPECSDGISRVYQLFEWTSISPNDRLLLVYWCVCLPILRRIGVIPIVRIQGGSSSGKTRVVDSIGYLINGAKTSAVPTAAAMTSSLSTEMITIDDNRESRDMTEPLRATLLQATSLGAKLKRKGNSDTETVCERVCGSLVMNGIEPIHDGRSELASRMLVLQSDTRFVRVDSPRSDETFYGLVQGARDKFLSESVFRCAQALKLDAERGEHLGAQIEAIFGSTRIGRLSAYLRVMYLAWVCGQPVHDQERLTETLHDIWASAFREVAETTLRSLIHEEMAVSAIRYAFAFAHSIAQALPGSDEALAFDGRYRESASSEDAVLGPVSIAKLARIVRTAARELNATRNLSMDLTASQLHARIRDGVGFLESAGFRVEFRNEGRTGEKARIVVYRVAERPDDRPALPPGGAAAGLADYAAGSTIVPLADG